jgi:hypothetical protein
MEVEDEDERHRRRLVKEGTPLAPKEPEGAPPPPPNEPEEVSPPSHDETKEVPPPPPHEPKEALEPQTVAVVRAPALNADEATWSVSLFNDA